MTEDTNQSRKLSMFMQRPGMADLEAAYACGTASVLAMPA